MRTQHGRRPAAALRRRGRLVEQIRVTHPRDEFGGPTTADPHALRGSGARDAGLGSHHRNELSGAQPAHLRSLPRVLCHRR
jgi:hypothetical protein